MMWGTELQLLNEQCAHIRFSAIALFSFLHKAVATFLAAHQVLHVWHVVETHAPSLLEIFVEVTFAAVAEDTRERMPGKEHFQEFWECQLKSKTFDK